MRPLLSLMARQGSGLEYVRLQAATGVSVVHDGLGSSCAWPANPVPPPRKLPVGSLIILWHRRVLSSSPSDTFGSGRRETSALPGEKGHDFKTSRRSRVHLILDFRSRAVFAFA